MALVVLFLGLAVAVVPDNNAASTIYAETCHNVEVALAKAAETGTVPEEKLRQFHAKCSAKDFQSGNYETRLSDFSELMENHVAIHLNDNVLRAVPANAMSTSGEESWGLYLNAVNASMQPPGGPEQTDAFKVHPDPLGQVRRWNSALFNYMPRDLPSHAVFSESIFERMTKATPLYAPQSLFDHHRALSAKRTALDTELKSLAATGSLSPAELDQVLAIKDSLRLTRHPKRLDSVEFHNLSERLRNPVPEIAAPVS